MAKHFTEEQATEIRAIVADEMAKACEAGDRVFVARLSRQARELMLDRDVSPSPSGTAQSASE